MLKEIKNTLKISLPLIFAQLLLSSIATVDTIMAGIDGSLTLAAIAQGSSLWIICWLLIMGVGSAISPLIAHAYGAKNKQELRNIFQQGFFVSLILGFVGTVITLLIPNLMGLFAVNENIIPEATNYLRVMAISMPFSAIFFAPRYLNEGIGNTKILLYIIILTVPINIIGNYVFLNGLLGFPKMGAAGIALSSSISIFAVAVMIWAYIFKSKFFREFELFLDFKKPNLQEIKKILLLGIPISISVVMEVGLFTLVTLLVGRFSIDIIAANQIALNYASLIFMIPLGISMGLTARIGMALGENNITKIKIIGFSGIFLGAFIMFISVIILNIFDESIVGLYTKDTEVIKSALLLIGLVAVFQVSDGVQVCAAGCLRGLKDTKTPMFFSIIGYWIIGAPLGVFICFYLEKGVVGLWLGLTAGLTISAILNTTRLYYLINNLLK